LKCVIASASTTTVPGHVSEAETGADRDDGRVLEQLAEGRVDGRGIDTRRHRLEHPLFESSRRARLCRDRDEARTGAECAARRQERSSDLARRASDDEHASG
jgi:hypothetical protein